VKFRDVKGWGVAFELSYEEAKDLREVVDDYLIFVFSGEPEQKRRDLATLIRNHVDEVVP